MAKKPQPADDRTVLPLTWIRALRVCPCVKCGLIDLDHGDNDDHEFLDPLVVTEPRPASRTSVLAVAIVLASRASGKDGEFFATVEDLMTQTGASQRTVDAALRQLRKSGYLERLKRGWRGRASEYALRLPSEPVSIDPSTGIFRIPGDQLTDNCQGPIGTAQGRS